MEDSEVDIRAGTPLDVNRASKANLVLLHEEQRRLKELFDRLMNNAKILQGVRAAMEGMLGLNHVWDFDNDYDPDDPPEKRDEEHPLKRLFGM